MPGIVSLGFYIPYNRLDKKSIFDAWGWYNTSQIRNKGEIAIAGYDEDCLTMCVSAGFECVKNLQKSTIDALYFASSTPPYQEPSNASIIATALDLDEKISAFDLTGSIRSGTTAMSIAKDSIENGSLSNVLICVSDDRSAKPANTLEYSFGNAAVSMLIGKNDCLADIVDAYHTSYNFMDYRRTKDDQYVRAWEERWIRDAGYGRIITSVVTGILKKTKYAISNFYKVIYPCSDMRTFSMISKKLNLRSDQIEDPLLDIVGNTSTPHVFLMLINALKNAKANDKILLINYGDGADGIILNVTEKIKDKKSQFDMEGALKNKHTIYNYNQFAVFENKLSIEKGLRGETSSAAISVLWRERKTILSLYGSRCKRCGTPVYPTQRVCVNPNCKAIDEMEDYRFAERKAKLFTFTVDNLTFSLNPPGMYGIVDFKGGGRYWFDLTDCEQGDLYVGMPMKMSFRKKFYDKARGLYGYFWKATPQRNNLGGGK